MTSVQTMFVAVVGLATLFTLLALVFLIHGAWSERRLQQLQPRIERSRLVLAAILASDRVDPADVKVLATLPHGEIIKNLIDLGRSLRGGDEGRLEAIARESGIWDRACELVSSRFWWRRLAGARLFTLFDSGAHFMPQLLTDTHPLVRAQLAEWTIRRPSPTAIEGLVRLVHDRDGLVSFSAKDALIRIGLPAVPALAAALAEAEGEDAVPLLEVAAAIPDPCLLAPALRLTDDPCAQVRALSTSLLGSLGGSEATSVLSGLLADPAPEVRAEAARAVGKLRHWPGAAELSLLLEDSSWDVRRQAGAALVAVGPPGLLLLRRALGSSDPFAVDMARRALDLNDLDIQVAVG